MSKTSVLLFQVEIRDLLRLKQKQNWQSGAKKTPVGDLRWGAVNNPKHNDSFIQSRPFGRQPAIKKGVLYYAQNMLSWLINMWAFQSYFGLLSKQQDTGNKGRSQISVGKFPESFLKTCFVAFQGDPFLLQGADQGAGFGWIVRLFLSTNSSFLILWIQPFFVP